MHFIHNYTEALGWALVHFLWEGTVVALLLGVVLRLLRRASAQLRYAATGLALLLMLGGFAVTLVVVWERPAPVAVPVNRPNEISTANRPYQETIVSSAATAEVPPVKISQSPLVAAAPVADTAPLAAPAPVPFSEKVRPYLPWAVGVWAVGVVCFALRFLFALLAVRGWKRSGQDIVGAEWKERFSKLCSALEVSHPARLLSSAAIAVPMVIGWLKPVVLVPAGLFTGLTTAELEAILAHELAHIRRHDYLTNLFQHLMETVFFYHPAVWWVSNKMRQEREHCCDDLAAIACGGALGYAKALTALEELRVAAPVLGVSASGGSLLARIRRIMGLPEEKSRAWPLGLLAVLALAIIPFAIAKEDGRPGLPEKERNTSSSEPRLVQTYKEPGTYSLTKDISLRILEFPLGKSKEQSYTGVSAHFVWKDNRFPPTGVTPKLIDGKTAMHMGLNVTFVWQEGEPTMWLINEYNVQQFDMTAGGEVQTVPAQRWDEWKNQAMMPRKIWEAAKNCRHEQDINPPALDHSIMLIHWPVIEQAVPKSKIIEFTSSGEILLGKQTMTRAELEDYISTKGKAEGVFHTLITHPEMSLDLLVPIVNKLEIEKVKFGVLAVPRPQKEPNAESGNTPAELKAAYRKYELTNQLKIIQGKLAQTQQRQRNLERLQRNDPSKPNSNRLEQLQEQIDELTTQAKKLETESAAIKLEFPVETLEEYKAFARAKAEREGKPLPYEESPQPRAVTPAPVPAESNTGSDPFAAPAPPTPEPTKDQPKVNPNALQGPASPKADGRDAHATRLPGTWALAGGVSLHIYGEVFHGSDVNTTAILSWPATANRPAQYWYTGIASDAFAARSLYAVAWDEEHAVLWIASRDIGSNAQNAEGKPIANRFKRVDFSDPSLITETYSNGWPKEHPPSKEEIAQMSTLMEVPQDPQPEASTLYSWSTAGNPERVNLSNVQNLAIIVGKDGQLTVRLQSDEKTCAVEELPQTIQALALDWEMKRTATLADLMPTQRVTLSTSADVTAEALQQIIQGCTNADFGPLASGTGVPPVSPDVLPIAPAPDPTKGPPAPNNNISPDPAGAKADGRDAQATNATPAVNVAREAGDYRVADGIKLHIIQIASDHGVQNRAVIKWSDRDGKVLHEHSFNLAHGTNVDPTLWRTGSPVFWVVYGNMLRKFDYTNPQNARESSDSNTAVSGGVLGGPAEIRALQEEIRQRQTNDVPVICGLSMQGIRKYSDMMDQDWMADYYDPKSKSGMPRDNVIFFGLDHLSSAAGGPNAGPWIYFLPGADHFHIKVNTEPFGNRVVIYGPILGHPVDVLRLSDWLKKSPIYRDAQKAGWMTEKLLISSDERFARLGMEWISQFPVPTFPRQYQALLDALQTNLKRNPPAAFAASLQESLDGLKAKAAVVMATWDQKRTELPDSAYTQGKLFPSPQDLKITWGKPAANGLRLGFSGVDEKTQLKSGDTLKLHIYVRNDGLLPVRFATSTANNFLDESLIDAGSNQHQAQWPGLCHMAMFWPLRYSLEPGHFVQVGEESLLLFQQEKVGIMEPKTEGKFFRILKQGEYRMRVEARFEEDDLAAEDGRVINVAPKGQWRGRLDASLNSLEITAGGTGVPPVSPDAGPAAPAREPTKGQPTPNRNVSPNPASAKADGRDAHATAWSATGRVTDVEDRPMPNVEIWVATGMGSLKSQGPVKTDADGRYRAEFLPGFTTNKDSPGLQFANITAHKSGFTEKNLSRHGAGSMAAREVPADALKNYPNGADGLSLPGRPRTVDFVMVPAVTIKGRLLGNGNFSKLTPAELSEHLRKQHDKPLPAADTAELKHSPLAGWKVWLKGKDLPPGASVIEVVTTDAEGNFMMPDVPSGFEWQFQCETNLKDHNEPMSPLFKAEDAGGQELILELSDKQENIEVGKRGDGYPSPAAPPAVPRVKPNQHQQSPISMPPTSPTPSASLNPWLAEGVSLMSPKTKPKAPTWLVDRVDGSRMEIVSELPKGLEWLDHNYPPSYKEYTLPSAFIDNCSDGLFSQQISDPVVDVEAP